MMDMNQFAFDDAKSDGMKMIIKKYLLIHGLNPDIFTKLIISIYSETYPNIAINARIGTGEHNDYIISANQNDEITIWCVATNKQGTAYFIDRGKTFLTEMSKMGRSARLVKMVLCTFGRISKHSLETVQQALFNEWDRLGLQVSEGISDFTIEKLDADNISIAITTNQSLAEFKNDILEQMTHGLKPPLEIFARLGASYPENDEFVDVVEQLHEDDELVHEEWSAKYKRIMTECVSIEEASSEERILISINMICEFISSTRMMGYEILRQQLSNILHKMNSRLWPNMNSSWQTHLLAGYDARLASCFIYTKLSLSSRLAPLPIEEIETAYAYMMKCADNGQYPRHMIIFRLIGLLIWELHKRGHYEKVLNLLNYVWPKKMNEDVSRLSPEEYALFLSFARLFIHAIKNREGEEQYHCILRSYFYNGIRRIGEGFWSKALLLLSNIYDDTNHSDWAKEREAFINKFNALALKEVNTERKIIIYMHLYSISQELAGRSGIEVYNDKIKILEILKHNIAGSIKHPTIQIYQVSLEMGAAFLSPWQHLPERFLKLERLIGSLQHNSYGLLIRLRFLRLFIMRVIDVRILGSDLLQQSRIMASIANGGAKLSLDNYFGTGDIDIRKVKKLTDIMPYINQIAYELTKAGISRYSTTILSNSSLPVGLQSRAAMDYLDFLSQAEAKMPNEGISLAFIEIIRAMEDKSIESPILHYYLCRVYYKHSIRDIGRALVHMEKYWGVIGDLERSRLACEYARMLYENIVYCEEDTKEEDANVHLSQLLSICKNFINDGNKKHFIAFYYGMALTMFYPSSEIAQHEEYFLRKMTDKISQMANDLDLRNPREILGATVYSTQFRAFLDSMESCSYVAASLLITLDSPEIYNSIATHLVRSARKNGKRIDMSGIKLIYDIAVGLAHGEDYYLPKYEFNRISCDIKEIQFGGAPRSQQDVDTMKLAIDKLHKLRFKFLWAHRYIKKDLCGYLFNYQKDPFILQILKHPDFQNKWITLRKAFERKMQQQPS